MSRLVSLSSTTRTRAGLFIGVVHSACTRCLCGETRRGRPWERPSALLPKILQASSFPIAMTAESSLSYSWQIFLGLRQEMARAEGLCHVAIAAGGPRLTFVAAQRIGSHRNERDGFQVWICLDAACRLVTV